MDDDKTYERIMTLVNDTFAHMEQCEQLLVKIQMQEQKAYEQVKEATETYGRAVALLRDYHEQE